MSSTGGDASLWLLMWEAWVLLHLAAVYCLRELSTSLSSAAPGGGSAGAASGAGGGEGGWVSAVPWKLLVFHLSRAVLVPMGMGFLPYWAAAAAL